MDIKLFKVDSKRAQDGDWVRNVPGLDGVGFKVRGFANKDYQAAIANERSKASPEMRVNGRIGGDLLPEIAERIVNRCIADHILMDWDGLENEGQPIAFSKDMALQFLTNPDYRPLSDAIFWAAREVEQVVEDRINSSEKN